MSTEKKVVTATISVIDIITANAAFPGLDGFMKAVGEKPIVVPFKFTDETRKHIRAWKRALKVIADDYDEARIALVKELSPVNEEVSQESLDVRKEFQARLKVMQAEEHTFDLPLLKQDGDLLRENLNPIPDTILEAIECVCVEGQPVKPAVPVLEGGDFAAPAVAS